MKDPTTWNQKSRSFSIQGFRRISLGFRASGVALGL